jgi:hypothetical protein
VSAFEPLALISPQLPADRLANRIGDGGAVVLADSIVVENPCAWRERVIGGQDSDAARLAFPDKAI